MTDLAQELHEKNHHFNSLRVYRIIVNPAVQGYPPLFLLCKETRAGKNYEFAIGISFTQFNTLLMRGANSRQRVAVAAKLGETLIPKTRSQNSFALRDVTGIMLRIDNVSIQTKVKKFVTEPPNADDPLFFFEVKHIGIQE